MLSREEILALPTPPSAKSRIDATVTQKKLAVAQQIIQAQDAELKALRNKPTSKPRAGGKVLRPVFPCHATELEYRRKIEYLLDKMQASVLYWLKAAFKANEPEVTVLAQDSMSSLSRSGVESRHAAVEVHEQVGINEGPRLPGVGVAPDLRDALAQDALPSTALRKAIRKLSRRWQRDFNEASWELAKWFGLRAHKRSTSQLHNILKKGGWTVEMKMSPAQRDILHATINENVSLIRSIPSQYFTQIEGMVMRSVQTGRDLHQLTGDLQRQYKVTRKRAELIARDQSNKVNAAFTRARQLELGITTARWVHSGAGKHPRPSHVAMNGQEYDVAKGMWDKYERKWITPGLLINCRCVSRSVVAGFS